jgi:hypothetical protein
VGSRGGSFITGPVGRAGFNCTPLSGIFRWRLWILGHAGIAVNLVEMQNY